MLWMSFYTYIYFYPAFCQMFGNQIHLVLLLIPNGTYYTDTFFLYLQLNFYKKVHIFVSQWKYVVTKTTPIIRQSWLHIHYQINLNLCSPVMDLRYRLQWNDILVVFRSVICVKLGITRSPSCAHVMHPSWRCAVIHSSSSRGYL